MKHKPLCTDLDDYESLINESGSVLSNGGGSNSETSSVSTAASNHGEAPMKVTYLKGGGVPPPGSREMHSSLILNPIG